MTPEQFQLFLTYFIRYNEITFKDEHSPLGSNSYIFDKQQKDIMHEFLVALEEESKKNNKLYFNNPENFTTIDLQTYIYNFAYDFIEQYLKISLSDI